MSWVLWAKYLAVLLVCGFCLGRNWRAQARPSRSWRDFMRDDRGGAGAMDFSMTVIFYLPVIMCTIQFVLILNAFLFTKYSSYCAARCACVVIPENEDGGRNQLSGEKKQKIQEAAAFAVSPVSPTRHMGGARDASSSKYIKGIHQIAQPVLSSRLAGGFARYDMWDAKFGNALAQTEVKLPAGDRYDVFDPVTVDVKYEYNLSLPFARQILREGVNALGSYCTLGSRCVILNEGSGEKPSDFGESGPGGLSAGTEGF